MASNGKNILNAALGWHNDAVNTYGRLDSASKKFQNKKHSKSIIKSAKDNVFEFPVFVSNTVPMDYATAANTLLEQCYASYLQIAITAQGPIISAEEARNGLQFAKFKSDTNKYLEYTDMSYAHDFCHNYIQEADYSVEFSLMSYEDSDARVINEYVDYQPLSEFSHFFKEEAVEYDEDYDWDRLYMEADNDYLTPLYPFPNVDHANQALYYVTDPDGNQIVQFLDDQGRTRYGSEEELMAYLRTTGQMNEYAAREALTIIRRAAREQGFQLMTSNDLNDRKYNDFVTQVRRLSLVDRLDKNNKNTQELDTLAEKFANDNGLDADELKKFANTISSTDAENQRQHAANVDNTYMRNIGTKWQNGIPLSKSEEKYLENKFDYTTADLQAIEKRIEEQKALKEIDIPHKKFQQAIDTIQQGGSLKDVQKIVPGFKKGAYDRLVNINKQEEIYRGKQIESLKASTKLAGANLKKAETDQMLSDALTMEKDAFTKKYIDTGKITKDAYDRLVKNAKSEETSRSARATTDRYTAIANSIRAGKKVDVDGNIGNITGVSDSEYNAIKTIVDREADIEVQRLKGERLKKVYDKLDRGINVSPTELASAGVRDEDVKNYKDLINTRQQIEKYNAQIMKRQADKTKGYYRALDDIKTTADTAGTIAQAVASGTRAAKEIATFKSDIEAKKAQASSAKTEAELKKLQLRDYEKDKDLERRTKEKNLEKMQHDIEMNEKDKRIKEQDMRNKSKIEGPEFIDEAKIQKLNTLKPILMKVDLRVMDDDGGLSTPVQYIVGVKSRARMIDAEILPEVAEFPLKKMDEISRKAKWRAGELKFLKDIVFKIDEKKQTAADKKDPRRNWYRRLYDLAHMKGDAPAAKVAEGKSLFHQYFKDKIGKGKTIYGVIPNCSMIITQADVNNIKSKTNINLLKASTARKFCKELFLLGFIIIDDDAESLKCMFVDLHNDFEVHSLASLKKQIATLDTAGTKTKDMFKLLG